MPLWITRQDEPEDANIAAPSIISATSTSTPEAKTFQRKPYLLLPPTVWKTPATSIPTIRSGR